ncbi:uncharacterized protein [Marmota flaviventris]|uniref:uncharacterized protein n=1 Tax=Marmota flaviventris TaxID=93162 RepID=UPI003A869825
MVFRPQGHIVGRPGAGCSENLRGVSGAQGKSAGVAFQPAALGRPNEEPPPRVFPATAVAVGEVQVTRHPQLTHTQTNPAAFQGNSSVRAASLARRSLASANCKVGIKAEDPHPVVQSLSPEWGKRDEEARKVRRARREAARHAPCDRHSVFSAVAQTLLDPQGYSSWMNPATTRCSLSPGRIRAQCPARTCPAVQPLRTLRQRLFFLGLFLFFPFSHSLQRALQPAAKFSQDPGEDIREMVERRARVRSAAWSPSPAGKLLGRVPSCHSSAAKEDSVAAGLRRASRVLPGSVRNCSWRSRGTPKPANGKQRDPEIGTKDWKEIDLEQNSTPLILCRRNKNCQIVYLDAYIGL